MGTTRFYLLPCKLDNDFVLDGVGRRITPADLNLDRVASKVGQPDSSGVRLKWSEVDWDDALSTVSQSNVEGCLALSEGARARLSPAADHPAFYGGFPIYEFMSIVHWSQEDSSAGSRFRGFHVEVVGAGEVRVRQLHGRNFPTESFVSVSRFDWARCDDHGVANGYRTLNSTARAGDSGAVFIELAYARSLSLRDPKLPFGS